MKNYNRIFAIIILIIMIPTMFFKPNIALADAVDANQSSGLDIDTLCTIVDDDINEWVRNWPSYEYSSKKSSAFYKFIYYNDNAEYVSTFFCIGLPTEKVGASRRVVYAYNSGGSLAFKYQIVNADGTTKEYPIEINVYAQNPTDDSIKVGLLKRQSANNFENIEKGKPATYLIETMDMESYSGWNIYANFTINFDNFTYEYRREIVKNFDIHGDIEVIDQHNRKENIFEIIWGWITDAVGKVKEIIESLLCKLFLAVADGILAAICGAVGEELTLDRVVFGKVSKLSINFWDNSPASNSVTSIMKPVVNTWFGYFRAIAVVVYLIAFLVVGIKIVLASTGEGKAKFNSVLLDWLVGVMLLFLCPILMKYTVALNNSIIMMLDKDLETNPNKADATPTPANVNVNGLSNSLGENNYVSSLNPDFDATNLAEERKDIMLYVRFLAGDLGKLSLVAVYYIMIGQLIAILIVYYKRMFMMAFLITIFPIVMIVYIIDKLSTGNSTVFKTWFKEYIILIFTQAFHAVTYVVVVDGGVKSYIESDNWLFMLMSVIFLFQGEKILRSIFGMKSSANTISDLAGAGVAAFGVAKKLAPQKSSKNDKEKFEEKQSFDDLEKSRKKLDSQNKSTESRISSTSSTETSTETTSESSDSSGSETSAATPPSGGTNTGNNANNGEDNVQKNFANAQTYVIANALHRRNKRKRGIVQKAIGFTGKVVGGTLGAAYGLAQGDLTKAVTNAYAGAKVGGAVAGVVKAPIRGISNAYSGHRFKKKMMRGDFDEELKEIGFDLAGLETEKQKAFRAALARGGAKAIRGGKEAGEMKIVKTFSDIKGETMVGQFREGFNQVMNDTVDYIDGE